MGKPIDLNKIKQLQARPKPTRGGRATKDPTEPRVLETWWKLGARFGNCENPDCTDTRPHKVVEGNTMVANVKERKMCRICFLAGWLSNG